MATIALEDIEVTSFFTEAADAAAAHDVAAQIRAATRFGCGICTGDISGCARTSIAGGCDTSVQCVTV